MGQSLFIAQRAEPCLNACSIPRAGPANVTPSHLEDAAAWSQVTATTPTHDVVVIGSGAGGGTVTKVLADLGISVLLLEAGPMMNPADLEGAHVAVRRAASGRRSARGRDTSADRRSRTARHTADAQIDGEPYTVAPGSDFSWFRSRILGGRTNHYGRVTLRFADYDFTAEGTGRPWCRLADRLRGSRALLRQGRDVHRRHRHEGRNPQRARRHLQSARATARARRPRAALLRKARHPRDPRRDRRSRRFRATAVRRATTADSAVGAARPRRTTRPATCRSFRQCGRAA